MLELLTKYRSRQLKIFRSPLVSHRICLFVLSSGRGHSIEAHMKALDTQKTMVQDVENISL